MFHPFIDCSKLSDDELLKKIQRCQDVVMQANMAGHNSMYQSAMLQLETYRSEWEERMFRKRTEEDLEKNPPGIIEIGTIQDIPSKYKDE
jgi:hypothetical protein